MAEGKKNQRMDICGAQLCKKRKNWELSHIAVAKTTMHHGKLW